jgi:transposase-like protein
MSLIPQSCNLDSLKTAIIPTLEATIRFLMDNNLIPSSVDCTSCRASCSLIGDATLTDGCIWRCPDCRKKTSIRHNSWFSGSKLSLQRMLLILYMWSQDLEQDYVKFEVGIGSDHTISNFFMYCRQICFEILETNAGMIGGPNMIVEVDEAKFGRRKFHRGKRVDGVWVFGCVERGSNCSRCVLVVVPDRTEITLVSEIQKFIMPGSIIYSDCWASYTGLEALGYIHHTVNHSKNFKDPLTGTHTNNIEGLWNQVRRSFPKFGTTKEMYASYLIEFMYRRRYFSSIGRDSRFPVLLRHLASLSQIW